MSFLDILGTVLPILDKIGLNPLSTRSYLDDKYDPQPTEEQKQLDLAQSNLKFNQNIATKNFNLQQEQFDYQKELNKQIQEREDTAIQRQVKDLQAAGLSPLMVSGGSAATPLTSANAPQYDLSGVNNALSNVFGAYNDIFNRNMQKRQFALQSKVQSAQLYNELLDSKLNREYLQAKLYWEKIHGFRDYNLSSEIINGVEKLISHFDKNSVVPGIPKVGDIVSANVSEMGLPGLSLLKNELSSQSKEKSYPVITKKQIDKDLNKIEKAQKSRVDNAISYIDISKDYDSKLKTIWDYTNAKDYYNDFDEFKIILGSKKRKLSYLNAMNIHYVPRESLKLGE